MTVELSPASWSARAGAAAIDAAAVALPALLALLLVPSSGAADVLVALALAACVAAGQLMLRGHRGATPGQLMTGIATVDALTGAPIGVLRCLKRAAVVAAGLLALGVGPVVVLASPWFDPRRVGWHDEVAGAAVVDRRTAGVMHPSALPGPASPTSVPAAAPATPVTAVRPPGAPDLMFGLMPEIERTRRAGPREDTAWDDESYRPPQARLEMSDDGVVAVAGTVLIGRNPVVEPGQTAVRLSDPTRSVSRVHLRLTVGPGLAWLEDLGSTNGSSVALPDGRSQVCLPGTPVEAPFGSVVRIGDAWVRLCEPDPSAGAFPTVKVTR